MRARIFRKKNLNDVDDQCLKDARTTCTDTGYTPNGAALVEVRLPVEQSVVFELVRATLCLVLLGSNALCLQERSFQ